MLALRRVLLLPLLLALCACTPRDPGNAVRQATWTGPDGKPLEKMRGQLGSGGSWRALLWGDRIVFPALAPDDSVTLAVVEPEAGKARFFDLLPPDLRLFNTLGLLPGPGDRIAWVYTTEKKSTAMGTFGPDGWVRKPVEILPGGGESRVVMEGGRWVGEAVEVVLWLRGGESHKDLAVVTVDGDSVQRKTVAWKGLAVPVPGYRTLLGARHRDPEGWHFLVSAPKGRENSSLWDVVPGSPPRLLTDSAPQGVGDDPATSTDRTAWGPTDFDPGMADAVWTAEGDVRPLEVAHPGAARLWRGLFSLGADGRLGWVPAFYFGGAVYQEVGDTWLSARNGEGRALLLEASAKGEVREHAILEKADFPTGSSDFVILPRAAGGLWLVDFAGNFLPVDPDALRAGPRP